MPAHPCITDVAPAKGWQRHGALRAYASERPGRELAILRRGSNSRAFLFVPQIRRHKNSEQSELCSDVEAPPGIEPGMKVLQTSALPLGYGANFGAGDGARTRHLRLGKAALYQMSYSRSGASEWT